ncbi:hypothetical protein AGR2A_pa30004 [Agrobacterium genomosp. 2 str. CFBP 5494]|uniref:Uncharacterized protein n=1 Tax=Agrobacterium genomosp. 2 str. CFBP 5494 TaxID=1183436 RepID=A0A9W5B6L7_9HYPH|nr:hypothetical protein AGR2A_pa30004 [Agrobacterium genomosp. 2 str. CFBP 5494]
MEDYLLDVTNPRRAQ